MREVSGCVAGAERGTSLSSGFLLFSIFVNSPGPTDFLGDLAFAIERFGGWLTVGRALSLRDRTARCDSFGRAGTSFLECERFRFGAKESEPDDCPEGTRISLSAFECCDRSVFVKVFMSLSSLPIEKPPSRLFVVSFVSDSCS